MKKITLIVFMLFVAISGSAQYTQGPIESMEGSGQLVLTFDDGPSEFTPLFLDLLHQYNVKATFFIMGNKINDESRPIIHRILQEGHILASHNWNHENLDNLGIDLWKFNYEKAIRGLVAIYKELNIQPEHYYYRAPFGYFPDEYREAQAEVNTKLFGHPDCVSSVGWSVKSADWRASQFAPDIYNRVLWQVADPDKFNLDEPPQYTMPRWNGGVILMHDGISLKELENPAKGLRPPEQVVETLKAVQLILENRASYGFDIASLDQVHEFSSPDWNCQLK